MRVGGGLGYLRGVTSKQFWFAVIFAIVAGWLFFALIRYADQEMSRVPTEQEKEEFWQRYSERQSEDRVITIDE